MAKKITTIEDLAEMIQRTMASKEDLRTMASKEDLKEAVAPLATKVELRALETRMGGLDARMDNLDARVMLLQSDVSDIKEDMVYRHEFDDARDRIKYVERKLGIESGV
ncbi:MAG: hypothetical protein WAP52_02430 [Candidatus Sungiibacteriota bacterium]